MSGRQNKPTTGAEGVFGHRTADFKHGSAGPLALIAISSI